MKSVLAYERRLQDLERQLQNAFRVGKVREVKHENNRWFIRLEDGEGDNIYRTDWVPWKSFAHGTISFSVPPRVGQTAAINSPNGFGELSYSEPYHYDPDHPSPHGAQNEVFMKIQAPSGQGGGGGGGASQGQQFLSVHATKDNVRIMRGRSMIEITPTSITLNSQDLVVNGQTIALRAKGLDAGANGSLTLNAAGNGSSGRGVIAINGDTTSLTSVRSDNTGTMLLATNGFMALTGEELWTDLPAGTDIGG